MTNNHNEEKSEVVQNAMRDTRRKVRYVILSSRKLNRIEMLREIRMYNYNNLNLKVRPGDTVTIQSDI